MEPEVFWLQISSIPLQVNYWTTVIQLVALSELFKEDYDFFGDNDSIGSFISNFGEETIDPIYSLL